MSRRWIRVFGLLLLCVYATAMAYQLLPLYLRADIDSFALCFLLLALMSLLAAATLPLPQACGTLAPVVRHSVLHSRRIRHSFSLRAPPASPF